MFPFLMFNTSRGLFHKALQICKLRPNFDHKIAHKLQKFRNLRQNDHKLQRNVFME